MLVISHRGERSGGLENTLDSFEAAVRLGVDGIETDVRLSADGQAILYHDRVTPDGKYVATLTRAELSGVVGYRVPTLDDALGGWDDVLWVVEVKTPHALAATVLTLRRFQAKRRCLLISFWHTVARAASEQLEVNCGLLIRHRPLVLVPPESLGAKCRVTTLVFDYEFLDGDVIDEAGALGWQSLVFGLKCPEDHYRCLQMGVAGIITDSPGLLPSVRLSSLTQCL